VSAIAIVAGVAFGRQSGFMVGALAALVSNFFFGQGPWTPWQMYAWGLVGYGAGLLAHSRLFERTAGVCAYGFAACLGYGFILNLWSILGFFHPQTASEALAVYAAALPFDIAHGIATVAFLLILYAPWRRKIARVKAKYGL
jgi:energy-coupling factor transport system substrate-specific component